MTEATNKLRGAIPFPEGGEGVVLRYTNADLAAIQEKFGDDWFLGAGDRLNRWDMVFTKFCLEIGGKNAAGKGAVVKFDTLDELLIIINERILDALYMAMFGRRYSEHLEYVSSRLSDLGVDQPPPLVSPVNTSIQ